RPQTHPIAESRESIDFIVEYQVFWGDAPVFIVEIKTGPKLGLLSAREEAKKTLIFKFLNAVSAIGTKLCFYTADDRVITPPRIQRERWDCDVLEAEGAAPLKAIIHEIQQTCAQLDSDVPDNHMSLEE
ncbi:hypothetical protein L208DRAFT_1404198, partial [Tricholoma matsutake]